jgi:hypothetical protein
MEPEDLPLHDLLGDDDVPPSTDDLRSIVSRARRRSRKIAALAATGALVAGGAVGGGIGYASSNHGNGSSSLVSAGAPNPGASGGSSGSSASSTRLFPVGAGGSFTSLGVSGANLESLFTRTANGVDIRAFHVTGGPVAFGQAACGLRVAQVQAEVSTAKMVGTIDSFGSATSGAVTSTTGQVVGAAEGDPTAVVLASTASTVTSVRVAFAGGASDRMTPVDGWVVLAGPVSSSLANNGGSVGALTAYNASGAVVATTAVTDGLTALPNMVCAACPAGPPHLVPGSSTNQPVKLPGLPRAKAQSSKAGSGIIAIGPLNTPAKCIQSQTATRSSSSSGSGASSGSSSNTTIVFNGPNPPTNLPNQPVTPSTAPTGGHAN